MSDSLQPKLIYALSATAAVGAISFIVYKCIRRDSPINPSIRKTEKKVGDAFDIEELVTRIKPGEKISLCRCWRSQKWPYCDGAHKEHNKRTGDNVGPVNITRKQTATI